MIINTHKNFAEILQLNLSLLKLVIEKTELDRDSKYSLPNRTYMNSFFINYFHLGRTIDADPDVEYSSRFEEYKEKAED
jgi:hypothetical protein